MIPQPNIRYLTDIYFDFGIVSVLSALLEKYNIRKPLVVTDKGIVQLGMMSVLNLHKVPTFDKVETNPTEESAVEATQTYINNNCDGIIAFGGGSPMDLAKCAAILVNHTRPLEQYAVNAGGASRIIYAVPPIIAIPTTAGSGSEVGRAALITNDAGKKFAIISDHLIPRATICDPELTINLPPLLSAATGMDAISHCVECYCSPRVNPVADAIALDGLSRGITNIVAASKGADRNARLEMMMCSLQGGLSFQKGLGVVHSLSHPLGGLTEKKLHHGTLNAIFLPHVLKFNMSYCKDKMKNIAKRLNIDDITHLPVTFAQLTHELGLPARLRDLGLTKDELKPLAEKALHDHCTPTNPRPMVLDDFTKLYDEAW